MNPSYTNGVGAPVSQVPVGQPQQPIISSGDVVLGGSSEKKSHKGVVILIILVVVLALVGGGFLLWQNGMFGGVNGSGSNQVSGLEEKYNSYVNYVLWGVESSNKPDLVAIGEVVDPYFVSLQNDEVALSSYIDNANAKYVELSNTYNQREEDKADITVLKSYFEDYAGIKEISTGEMIQVYKESGKAAVQKMIDQSYAIASTERYLSDYLAARINFANAMLEKIELAAKTGCIKDNEMMWGCDESLVPDDGFMGALNNAMKTQNALTSQAMNVMTQIYTELYGSSGESE